MKPRLFGLVLLLIFSLGFFAAARSAASWRPKVTGVHKGAYDFQFSPDGRWLLSTSQGSGDLIYPQQSRRLFDLSGQRAARSFDAALVKFSLDSRALFVFDSRHSRLSMTNTEDGAIKQSWQALTPQHYEAIDDVQLQKGGRELVAVTPFRIWRLDVQSGKKLSQTPIQIRNQEAAGCGLMGGETLLKDGHRLLYLNADEAWIYDIRTGKRRDKAEVGVLSTDEKWQWNYNAEVGQFWLGDFSTGKNLWDSDKLDNPQFSGDGQTLIDVNDKLGVRLLNPRTGHLVRKLKAPIPRADVQGTNATFALSPDNNYWFAREADKIVRYRLR